MESARCLPTVARFCPGWPNLGQCWLEFDQTCAIFAERGLLLVWPGHDKHWLSFARRLCADFELGGQIWPGVDQIWTGFGRIWPISAELDPMLAKTLPGSTTFWRARPSRSGFGQSRHTFDQIRSVLADSRIWSNAARTRPDVRGFCRSLPTLSRISRRRSR